MVLGSQRQAPTALPPGMTRYPLYRRLGGSRARLDRCGKYPSPKPFMDNLISICPPSKYGRVAAVDVFMV